MNKKFRWIWLTAAIAFGNASAQMQMQPQVTLDEGKSGAVSWVSGGVNRAEIDVLHSRQKQFPLKLVFTLTTGNYTAGVDVKIANMKGTTVLETSNTGPMLLANLPRGSYTVTAVSEGRSQTRKVEVGERLRTEYMRWKPTKDDFVIQPGGGTAASSASAMPR